MQSLHLVWVTLMNMIWPPFLLLLIRNKKLLFLKWGFCTSHACVHIIDIAERETGFENFYIAWCILFVTDGKQRHGAKWGLAQICCQCKIQNTLLRPVSLALSYRRTLWNKVFLPNPYLFSLFSFFQHVRT